MNDTSPIDSSVEYGAVYASDDDYANDDGFVSYVPTTIDPGMAVFVATGIYCFIIMILLPVLVSNGRKRHTRKMALENSIYGDRLVTGVPLAVNPKSSGAMNQENNMVLIDRDALRPARILIGNRLVAGVETALCRNGDAPGDLHSSASISESKKLTSVSDQTETKKDLFDLESGRGKLKMVCQRSTNSDSNMLLAVNPKSSDAMNQENNMVLNDRDALRPVRILFGKGAIFSVTSLIEGFKYLIVLSKRDDETKKIIGLAAPMTASILAAAIF